LGDFLPLVPVVEAGDDALQFLGPDYSISSSGPESESEPPPSVDFGTLDLDRAFLQVVDIFRRLVQRNLKSISSQQTPFILLQSFIGYWWPICIETLLADIHSILIFHLNATKLP
jgi:hypothetical protein